MPKPRRLSRTCHFVRLPTALRACARCWPVLGAFHDAPCASAIRSRSLQWVFSTASGREFEILFSSGPPLTSLSPHWFAHHARATMSTNSAEIAFPILPVKRERLPRPETPSIETMPKDPRYPCGHPPSASTNPRFCHRGSPSDALSPGAVSRFGLAPVHPVAGATRASLGVTSSFDFCNTTRRADSPRDSFVPRAWAGQSQSRSPRLPLTFGGETRTSRLRAAPFSFERSCEQAPAGGTEIEEVLARSCL